MLKFLKSGSNFMVKVRRSQNLVPIEKSCRKYKNLTTYYSKYMANVKVFKNLVKIKARMSKGLVPIEIKSLSLTI
jgi:hypothetical protein